MITAGFNAIQLMGDEEQRHTRLCCLISRLFDGLSSEALHIAIGIGTQRILGPDGIPQLIEKIRERVMEERYYDALSDTMDEDDMLPHEYTEENHMLPQAYGNENDTRHDLHIDAGGGGSR